MRLQTAQLQFNDRVTTEARRHGYTVFAPQRENQRRHDPSLILVRGPRVILLWLRMGRRKLLPQVDQHGGAGREAYGFWPADWPLIVRVLIRNPAAATPAPVAAVVPLTGRLDGQDGPDGDGAA